MAEFDLIFKCSYGGAAFQLVDYALTSEGTFAPSGARTGTKVRVSGAGYVAAASPADLTDKLKEVRDAFGLDGRDLVITGLGGAVQVEVLAAQTLRGGPRVERFELGESLRWPAMVKPVTFQIFADRPAGTVEGLSAVDAYTVTTATRADGLRQIGYGGDLSGPDASKHWREVVLPKRLALFGIRAGTAGAAPPAPPVSPELAGRWVPDYEEEVNEAGDAVRYRLTFTELKEPIPAAYLDPAIGAVDFEFTLSASRDDQMRQVETRQYDVLLTGNVATLLAELRPRPPVVVVNESVRWTNYRERRVQATFVTLASGDGNGLLDWRQTLSVDGREEPVLHVVEYDGLPPTLLRRLFPVQRARQSGRAVGVGQYPKPAAPFFPGNFSAPRRVERNDLSNFEKETTWSYEYVFNGAVPNVALADLDRPHPPDETPGFDAGSSVGAS